MYHSSCIFKFPEEDQALNNISTKVSFGIIITIRTTQNNAQSGASFYQKQERKCNWRENLHAQIHLNVRRFLKCKTFLIIKDISNNTT